MVHVAGRPDHTDRAWLEAHGPGAPVVPGGAQSAKSPGTTKSAMTMSTVIHTPRTIPVARGGSGGSSLVIA